MFGGDFRRKDAEPSTSRDRLGAHLDAALVKTPIVLLRAAKPS